MIELTCRMCNKKFHTSLCRVTKRKFCSNNCRFKAFGVNQKLTLPPLTKRQIEIINGCLLGDGTIEKPNHGGNCRFTEGHTIAYEEYVLNLYKEFGEWANKIHYKKEKSSFVKGRLVNAKAQVHIRSKKHDFLTTLRSLWYPDGIKIIPTELELTPLTLTHWYCGDGYITEYNCLFCTDGFTTDEVNLLSAKLKYTFDIETTIYFHDKRPRLRIKNNSWKKFFELIRPHMIFNCFQYKIPTQEHLDGHKFANDYYWELKSPEGKIYNTTNLSEFARNNNLNINCLFRMMNGKRNHHKGWTKVDI